MGREFALGILIDFTLFKGSFHDYPVYFLNCKYIFSQQPIFAKKL